MRKLLTIISLLIIASCAPKGQQDAIRIAALRGPSSEAMKGIDAKIYSDPLQIRKLMLKEEVDFAVLPSNMAALLYNKGVDYIVAAVPLWGSLYLCSFDENVRTLEDFRGREIFVSGKGLNPDIVLRHILSRSGMKPFDDVKINYRLNGHTELANAAIAGMAPAALLAEPFVSQVLAENPRMHIVSDLGEEWHRLEGRPMPITALMCRKSFAVNHPKEVAEVLEMCGVEKASQSKEMLYAYLEVILNDSPDAIGGKLPDENFLLK